MIHIVNEQIIKYIEQIIFSCPKYMFLSVECASKQFIAFYLNQIE